MTNQELIEMDREELKRWETELKKAKEMVEYWREQIKYDSRKGIFKIYTPKWIERLARWLVCSWFHKSRRCYPNDSKYWHCEKCHPCGEELDRYFK